MGTHYGTIARVLRDLSGRKIAVEGAVPARQFKVPSDGVMADVFLGVTVTSLYALVGLGIIVAFM
jgi:hypothetical protein